MFTSLTRPIITLFLYAPTLEISHLNSLPTLPLILLLRPSRGQWALRIAETAFESSFGFGYGGGSPSISAS